jgi:anti-anti-sigma regulatory factor
MTAEHSQHHSPPLRAGHSGHSGHSEPPIADEVTASVTDDDGIVVITVSRRVERESSDAGPDDSLTVIDIDGEIDVDTVPLVELALAQGLAGRMAVCCDLTRVTFLGAAGAHALLTAHVRAVAARRVFYLRGVQGIAAHVLNAIDPGRIVPR